MRWNAAEQSGQSLHAKSARWHRDVPWIPVQHILFNAAPPPPKHTLRPLLTLLNVYVPSDECHQRTWGAVASLCFALLGLFSSLWRGVFGGRGTAAVRRSTLPAIQTASAAAQLAQSNGDCWQRQLWWTPRTGLLWHVSLITNVTQIGHYIPQRGNLCWLHKPTREINNDSVHSGGCTMLLQSTN